MAKVKENAKVLSQEELSEGIYSMWIGSEAVSAEAVPGQFISLYSADGSRLLPRPISLCEIDRAEKKLRIVYRVAGAGTEEFSHLKAGDTVDILGPLGNGFPLEAADGKTLFLIGGGIGVPPMLEVAKQLKAAGVKATAVLGYRDDRLFLKEDFDRVCEVVIATEDGSVGTRGNVLDAIREKGLQADMIFSCGPTPMLRALKAYGAESHTVCYISMEEKMACGVGACLACVCKSKEVDDHSHVHNKRICKDGPVFLAEEVEL